MDGTEVTWWSTADLEARWGWGRVTVKKHLLEFGAEPRRIGTRDWWTDEDVRKVEREIPGGVPNMRRRYKRVLVEDVPL